MTASVIEPRVLAVVVNWNSGSQLKECLQSLAGQCNVMVVDNGSSDGSQHAVLEFKGVGLIESNQNLGFGKACNLGARQADADYLLFLNPDARLFDGALEHVRSAMAQPENAQIGICGVQLHDESGQVARSCARFPSPLSLFVQTIGFDKIWPRLALLMTDWDHDETRTVDHVIGAFFFVRKSVFDQLGGFDERFFLYLEDLDFSLRARRAGFRTLFIADAQSFHRGGGTSDKVKAHRLFYVLRSRLLYAQKHFNRSGFLVVLLATLFLEPVSRTLLALAKRSLAVLDETWRAYWMLWRWLMTWCLKGRVR